MSKVTMQELLEKLDISEVRDVRQTVSPEFIEDGEYLEADTMYFESHDGIELAIRKHGALFEVTLRLDDDEFTAIVERE